MVDMFPFPSVTEGKPEKQIAEIVNYLIQFKETLEFALANISAENLSPDLVNKLNELGTNIAKSNEERENEVAQITTNALTVSDVCNSDLFKLSVESEISNTTFNINFETGHLEYSRL
jgi:hypothetical protein